MIDEEPEFAGELRNCAYCGDIFIPRHGLQQFCPEKYGRTYYCKNKQKALVSEKRLAEIAIELSKTGINVTEESPLTRNIRILSLLMYNHVQMVVTSALLDNLGYQVLYFSSKVAVPGTDAFMVSVGGYLLKWIGQDGDLLTFEITKQ